MYKEINFSEFLGLKSFDFSELFFKVNNTFYDMSVRNITYCSGSC